MAQVCLGHESLADADLGTAKEPTIPAGTRTVWITVDTSPVRFTMDGTTPSATVGLRLYNDANPFSINNVNAIENLQFIKESGNPNIQLAYFGDDT